MLQRYLIYTKTNPFLGYLAFFGQVDPDQISDGSTVYEYVHRKVTENSDLVLHLYPLDGVEITEDLRETKKFNPATQALVSLDIGNITPAQKAAATEAAKIQAIRDNLPSWSQVSSAVDGIANLADAKVFLKKLARIVYWLAKNSEA